VNVVLGYLAAQDDLPEQVVKSLEILANRAHKTASRRGGISRQCAGTGHVRTPRSAGSIPGAPPRPRGGGPGDRRPLTMRHRPMTPGGMPAPAGPPFGASPPAVSRRHALERDAGVEHTHLPRMARLPRRPTLAGTTSEALPVPTGPRLDDGPRRPVAALHGPLPRVVARAHRFGSACVPGLVRQARPRPSRRAAGSP
jgi:hypothetical protein